MSRCNYTSDEEYSKYLKKITEAYNKKFNNFNNRSLDGDDMMQFFEIVKKYADKYNGYEHFGLELKTLLENKFESFEANDKKVKAVEYITSILIRIYYCNFVVNNKKNLCVIDNIECYAKYDEKHPIQYCELQTVLDGVIATVQNTRPHILHIESGDSAYKTFYGFMLVTRDTSASMADYHHYDDYSKDSEIDITDWYCADEIFENKIKYFIGEDDIFQNEYYKAYVNIMNDLSAFNWGMHDLVNKMYNYNKRRIARDVTSSIIRVPEEDIKYFNETWYDACKNPDKQYNKHMCRKFIFRILLDNVQEKNYFEKLLVENNSAATSSMSRSKEHSSYARKIATVLYRVSLKRKDYISFPDIIAAVLEKPYIPSDINDDIEYLGKILYLMNETRNVKTNWAPLIMIKFDAEQSYNKENLIAALKHQWFNINRSKNKDQLEINKYGVKITETGKFFAKICPDFEYFACRFAKEYPALFVPQNLQLKIENGRKEFGCVRLANIVRKNAFMCIDEVIKRDKEFFSSLGEDSPRKFAPLYNVESMYKWLYCPDESEKELIVHPVRIINHHMGYLTHFNDYVRNLSDNMFQNESEKNKIIERIGKIIYEYQVKLDHIVAHNFYYLNKI